MSASFVYDGMGRREAKTINNSLTEFLYDGLNPVQETSGATILANILPGLGIDEFLTRTDVVAGVTSHFLTDALGSPVAVTDNAGVVQTEYTYEPFGRTTVSGAANSSSYQYTGRENDGMGLFYYRNRYYHPQLQRFISEDPIELGGGDINLFSYVKNAPLNYIDSLGLVPIRCGMFTVFPCPPPKPKCGPGGRKDDPPCPKPEPKPTPKLPPQIQRAPDPIIPDPKCVSCYKPEIPQDQPCTAGLGGTVCVLGQPVNSNPPESMLDKLGSSITELLGIIAPGGSPLDYGW